MSTILNPLYFAVSWVIVTFHSLLGYVVGKDQHESIKWSLAIIGLVILIRIILIPLFVKQIKSQRALTALQPHMKEIQKKYKDDRQKQSEEMMKLYKEHKTNPLASCFPILAQAPIFFALFTVLNTWCSKRRSPNFSPKRQILRRRSFIYILKYRHKHSNQTCNCCTYCLYVSNNLHNPTSVDG